MKVELETRFNPGDVVWRKNPVTNEAHQTTITHVEVYFFAEKDKQSYYVIYKDEEGPMCNLPGKVSAENAFATKEEADACPAYDPK